MNGRTHQPYWVFLYGAFLQQTEPQKSKEHLAQLEDAMWERLQELERESSPYVERAAIQAASNKLLGMKTDKLGFPPIKAAWPFLGVGLTPGSLARPAAALRTYVNRFLRTQILSLLSSCARLARATHTVYQLIILRRESIISKVNIQKIVAPSC